MISQIYIDRPKLAIVIAVVTMIAGAMCILKVPVAEYPEIAPPQIMVSASYPGASAQEIGGQRNRGHDLLLLHLRQQRQLHALHHL